MFTKEAEIRTLDEVTEANVKYWFVDESGARSGKWIWIEQDKALDNEFVVNYWAFRLQQLYQFVTRGGCVRTWKTFGGALRWAKKNLPFPVLVANDG